MLLRLFHIAAALSVILPAVPALLAQSASAAPVQSPAATSVPVITLQDAIARAQVNDPAYATSVADRGVAHLDHGIARSSLLPIVTYHNQYLYTQPNGLKLAPAEGARLQDAPIFIANNAVHEYMSQGMVTETLNPSGFADVKRAGAASAKADADLEIARRNLIVTVATAYFTLVAEEASVRIARRAADEAQSFANITQKLENGREVAHADVVKADLGLQQRQRDLADTQLAAEKARLDLGALILPDPRAPYTLADSDLVPPAMPLREQVDAAASKNNPELKSALEALHMSQEEVSAARAAYLPTLSLNYTYGIDAAQFAANSPDHAQNVGFSAFVNLDFPVWDWFATHDRVKQSELKHKAAQTQLTFAQKKLVANLDEFYNEAKVASDELVSLNLSAKTGEESLRLTKLRYSAGEATALEVVDAENAATQAETASADGAVRYRVALANLQTLTGAL